MQTRIKSVLEKCNIYYNGALISREHILEKYISFFTDTMSAEKRSVGIALHTGSVCFDIVSIVSAGIGCLAYNLATNDDIIAKLQPGDMVMYGGRRYRWLGIENMKGTLCFKLEQDGVGKNSLSGRWLPYDRNKHLVMPYYGDSNKTDGRGIKRKENEREQFLSYIFNIPITEVPIEIDVSVVIVADRGAFADICKGVCIEYAEDKRIGLLDVIQASYYTRSGAQYQFGMNPTKTEPTIKVTNNFSTARELVLDKHRNQVIGLLVFGTEIPVNGSSELSDMLRRKVLKFVVVETTIHSKFRETVLNLCEDASFFACTRKYLALEKKNVKFSNKYTEELSRQASLIINSNVIPIKVEGGIDSTEYSNIMKGLFSLKQSCMSSHVKDEFILTAHGILNLLNTAVFTMNEIEEAIQSGIVSPAVKSPQMRIDYLWGLTEDAGDMMQLCMFIVDVIECQYRLMCVSSPKADVLHSYIAEHIDSQVAIILPKAYYVNILRNNLPQLSSHPNVILVTPNKLDVLNEYDAVVVVGDINSRKFDPLTNQSTVSVQVLLYDCERKSFLYRIKKAEKYEIALNRKIGILENTIESEQYEEEEMEKLSSLNEYIDSLAVFDVYKLATNSRQSYESLLTSEVTHIGKFVSGEQICFSKYYAAVVYDTERGTVTEKSPGTLASGDVLVFAIRGNYMQNIVDSVYQKLLTSDRFSEVSLSQYKKSLYWKKCLREYKSKHNLSYRDITKELRECGSVLQEMAIRQWLMEDSHIVGPRNKKTMGHIALVTGDLLLLADVSGYFEACKCVRHKRHEILKWIAKVINDKLRGFTPKKDGILEIVYDNIERLSETKELEEIIELSESVEININLVNRPITETEV